MVSHCTIEYLQNLQQLLVFIQIDTNINDISTKLFINRSLKTLTVDDDGSSELLISVAGKLSLNRLSLPISCPLKSIPQVNIIDNVLVLQFRNVIDPKIDSIELIQPITSKDLATGFTGIACNNCMHQLRTFDNIVFHDLPNEHWLELLDCWSCHDNEFAPIAERALGQSKGKKESSCSNHEHCSSSVSKKESSCSNHDHCSSKNLFPSKSYNETNNSDDGLILPKPGKIFSGLRHIIFNSADFDLIQCPKCKSMLGSKIRNGENLKINRETIKYCFSDSTTREDSFKTILMHQILDVIDNHSTFHFILSDSSGRKLYLKPISWKTKIYDEISNTWKFSFKIGFSENVDTSRLDAEVISCSKVQFDEIKSLLQNNHENMLFGSSIKIPGSEKLYLSYLIN